MGTGFKCSRHLCGAAVLMRTVGRRGLENFNSWVSHWKGASHGKWVSHGKGVSYWKGESWEGDESWEVGEL